MPHDRPDPPPPLPFRRPRPAVALVLLAVLALSACSTDDSSAPAASNPGASNPAASNPAASNPAASIPVTQAPDDPLAPRPGLESAPPPGLPACGADTLTLADADAVYGADTVQELFTVRTSGPDCELPGEVPAVQVLGDGLTVEITPGGPGLPVASGLPVTLSRTTSLSFFLLTGRDGECVPATSVRATLPGTDAPLSTTTALQVCGGSVSVGPLQRLADDEG